MKKIERNLEILSAEDIARIHAASLEILSEVGIRVKSDFGRKLLLDNGCTEINEEFISIPAALIEDSISKNRYFSIVGRDPAKRIDFGKGEVYAHNFGSVPTLINPDDHTMRNATLDDVIDSYRVLDKLDSMDVVGALLSPVALNGKIAQIVSVAAALQNSTKPMYFTALNRHEAKAIARLMRAAAGDSRENNGIIYASNISPLFFDDDCFGVIDEAAKAGIPLCSLCCPTMGLTAPMALAGAIAQQNAETLAFNLIAKLINPDEQVVYGSRLGFANMRDMKRMNGLPEEGVIGASVAQLARHYNMVSDVYGTATRAHTPADVQLGYEKAVCGYLPILAGADMVSGIGNMSSGAGTCLECLVIDNDIFSMMFKGARGVDTLEEDCFPTEVIKEVAHEHETFISQEHTVDFLYNDELWHGGIGVEFDHNMWVTRGTPHVSDRARAKVSEILAAADEIPALPAVDEELKKIVEECGLTMDGVYTKH